MNRYPLKIPFAFFLFVVVQNLIAADNVAKPVISINTPLHPPATTMNHDGFEDRLAQELFGRLGFKTRIQIVPAERGLISLNNGLDDAILSRVAGLEKKYPNIVPITESVNEREYVAFARKGIKIKSWADLSKYDVTHVTGWKIFEKNVKQYRTLVKVREPQQMFRLIEKKRVDVVLYGRAAGQWMIKELGLAGLNLDYSVLAKKKKYFYMHKKHALLAAQANKVLREIKNDGTYDKIKCMTQLEIE